MSFILKRMSILALSLTLLLIVPGHLNADTDIDWDSVKYHLADGRLCQKIQNGKYNSNDRYNCFNFTKVLLNDKKCKRAKALLDLLIESLDFDEDDYLFRRGQAYYCLNDKPKALEDFRKAYQLMSHTISKYDKNPELYTYRADLLFHLQLYEAAIKDYLAADKYDRSRIDHKALAGNARILAENPSRQPFFTLKQLQEPVLELRLPKRTPEMEKLFGK